MRLITDFTREVERQGEGIPGRDGLLHQIKQPQNDFRVAVRRTAPYFVPQYRGRPASPATLASEEPEPEPIRPVLYSGPFSASASATPARTASAASIRSTSVLQTVEKHTRPPFLEGEEASDEIGLNDGNEVFIDDVLETAEWCVP